MSALVIDYFIDLRFVLSDNGMYNYHSEFIMNYQSLHLFITKCYNIIRFFALTFLAVPEYYHISVGYLIYFTKSIVILLTFIGVVTVSAEFLKKSIKSGSLAILSFNNQPPVSYYFLQLFWVVLMLFFMKKLPLGPHRLNSFAIIMLTFFLLEGLTFLAVNKNKIIRLFGYSLIPFVLFAAFFQIGNGYLAELKGHNLLFDQKIYDNAGNAINEAYKNNMDIFVLYDTFAPESIMYRTEELMIKSHHYYKADKPIKIFVLNSENEIMEKLAAESLKKVILLGKYDFKIISEVNLE